jgi:hypothetical protein
MMDLLKKNNNKKKKSYPNLYKSILNKMILILKTINLIR